MAFNPLEHTGTPVDQQFRSLREISSQPYDKRAVDPYTRTRVILMNGIEVESIIFSHQFARHTDNLEIKRALALSRRIEQQQQKVVDGLHPGDQSTLETTIGFEQTAVDLTAWLARNEPDPQLKQALDFALLEDFDHLYRYANLYDLIDGKDAAELTQHLTEITPGRPTMFHHRHPHDEIRPHFDTHTVHPQSRLNVMTIVAAEQQTMNFYMNHHGDYMEPIVRELYDEIAMVEESHVTHYESLLDPLDSWLKTWLMHEYVEVYLYWSMLQTETDLRIKSIWERHLDMELGQLHVAAAMLRRYEGVEPEELLPPSLPEQPLTFEPNKEYVRQILASQVDLEMDGLGYAPMAELPANHRFHEIQRTYQTSTAAGERVIDLTRDARGREYRDETEGPNPIERFQDSMLRS